jgi:hypothetical protein
MEVFKEGDPIEFGQLPTSVHISGATVLLGAGHEIKLDSSQAYRLLHFLEPNDPAWDEDEDDDWDNEDDLDKTYRRDMIEHRLHENATAAMREMIVKAGLCSQEGRILGKDTLRRRIKEIARASYQMAHAMQNAFEQTQGGFTEAPASSETEAAVAHREADVFVVRTYEGPLAIKREWLEEKKQEYGPLDVYAEVRKAVDKLNERSQLSLIPGHVEALRYIESCFCSSRDF